MAATGSEKQGGDGVNSFYVSTPSTTSTTLLTWATPTRPSQATCSPAGTASAAKVWYLTGTDEHGQKIMRTAEANNVTPQAWCDKLVEEAWKPSGST